MVFSIVIRNCILVVEVRLPSFFIRYAPLLYLNNISGGNNTENITKRKKKHL